ncbi:MAG: hypothetical protein AAF363_01880 [Bacteroidota bacterium]
MKKILFLFLVGTLGFYLTSCDDDDTPPPSSVVSISGIPATAEVQLGGTLSVPNVVLTATDGFATANAFTLSVDGGAAIDLSALIAGNSPQTVTVSATTTDLGLSTLGNATLVFTLTDANGETDTFTHILSVVAETGAPTIIVSSNIDENTTWFTGNIYELATRVIVEPGAALTIQPGVIVKGQFGDGANATALIIARGAQIFAEGTAAQPIIMTATADDIQPGEIVSPNLNATNSGLWGGFIVLGNAPISEETNNGTDQIEGIPPDEGFAEYGGNDSDDNSGIIRYVSVRHGGAILGDGDEINGISLGGVGSGTTIEFIEVVGNLDDGIEWFGGNVDVTNAIVWAADDDAIDIDQAYSGTIDNVIVVAFPGTDHAFEIDGPEGTLAGSYTITRASARGADDEIANFRDGATGSMNGAYFFNFVAPSFDTNGEEEGGTGEGDFRFSDDNTFTAYDADELTFSNLQITLADGTQDPMVGTATIAEVFADFDMTDQDAVMNVANGSQSQGADASAFANWSFTAASNALTGF